MHIKEHEVTYLVKIEFLDIYIYEESYIARCNSEW